MCVLLLYSAQHQQPASISSVSSTAQRYEAENLFLHKEHDQSKSIPINESDFDHHSVQKSASMLSSFDLLRHVQHPGLPHATQIIYE